MDPATDRFFELAVRPLADNAELHLTAAGELRRRIAENPASPARIEEAANALDAADRHPHRKWWRAALYLTTLVVSVPVLVHTARNVYQVAGIELGFFGIPSLPTHEADPFANIKQGLDPQQKLLLFGNDEATAESERWKPLWDSEPDNPAYLARYAAAYILDHKNLSPEILDAIARIDPENGWYPALSAGELADKALKKGYQTGRERKEGATPVWKIKDLEKLKESLALIHQAATKPEFDSHEEALIRQRIPLLPGRKDWVSQFPPLLYVANQPTAIVLVRSVSDVLSAGAQECAANQDVAGFRQIVSDWRKLTRTMAENGFTLVDLLVAKACYFGPTGNFRNAAQSLGLAEDSARFAHLHDLYKQDKEDRRQRSRESTIYDFSRFRGSLLATMTIPITASQVKSPPSLADADLRPTRYADHAMFTRGISVAAWALLGIFAGLAALHRYRQSRFVRILSTRTPDLFRATDWAWTLLGGIGLPFLWHLAITRLTRLSAREWSLGASGFIQPTGQSGALAVSMVVFPLVIAAWRLGKRGHAFGLKTPHEWLGWLAAGAATLAVPAFGAIMLGGPLANTLLIVACVLAGIPVLWLLVGFSRNVLGKHPHALRRATLARIALPAWIFGMLVLAASLPLHYLEECYWIQQDHLFDLSTDPPKLLSRYEWEVTQILRKELLETMD